MSGEEYVSLPAHIPPTTEEMVRPLFLSLSFSFSAQTDTGRALLDSIRRSLASWSKNQSLSNLDDSPTEHIWLSQPAKLISSAATSSLANFFQATHESLRTLSPPPSTLLHSLPLLLPPPGVHEWTIFSRRIDVST